MLADSPTKARAVALQDFLLFAIRRFAASLGAGRGEKGLVSIVIPALEDRAELLGTQALPSVRNQTYEKIEVIVVSENYSAEIHRYVNDFGSQCRYVWGVKKSASLVAAGGLAIWFSGAAPALIVAHKKSRGQYIARLDDDDVWMENHIENSVSFLQKSGSHFVSSRAFDSAGNYLPELSLSDQTFGDVYRWAKFAQVVGTPITWVYERTVIGVRYNPRSWKKKSNRPGDYDLMLRLAAARVKMGFSPLVSARQLERPSSRGLTGSQAFLAETNSGGPLQEPKNSGISAS